MSRWPSKNEGRVTGADWDGSYGYGTRQAHPCVQRTRCPVCRAGAGVLCLGVSGARILGTHYQRRSDYMRAKRHARMTRTQTQLQQQGENRDGQ